MGKRISATAVLLATLLCTAGCNRRPAEASAANAGAANDSADEDANNAISEDRTVDPADQALTAAGEDATAKEAGGGNAVARKAGQPLTVYVGHYPFDALGGTSFRDDPIVKKAVIEAVPDRQIRDFVLNSTGPESKIKLIDGRVLAWGCQAHDCGAHHWSVAIAPDGGKAEVCYFDSEDQLAKARYFSRGSKVREKRGSCPDPDLQSTL